VRRFAALGLVLVVLYYLVAQTLLIRNLSHELAQAEERTQIAREDATADRANLETRLDDLQTELESARSEVAALREQLIQAGLTPVTPTAVQTAPGRDETATPAQQPTGTVKTAPRGAREATAPDPAPAPAVTTTKPQPQPAPPAAPNPAPQAPAVPAAPTAPDVPDVGPLCVLILCIGGLDS
jgi:hypothetical protein